MWVGFSWGKTGRWRVFAYSVLSPWHITMASPREPIKNYSYFVLTLRVSWSQARCDLARCFGGLSLKWQSWKLEHSLWGPNLSLLKEMLGIGSSFPIVWHGARVRFMVRVCLSLSYPFAVGIFSFVQCLGVAQLFLDFFQQELLLVQL